MTVAAKQMTAEELIKLPRGQFRYELCEASLSTMLPAGHHHAKIATRIGAVLDRCVEENKLGAVYTAETGFKLQINPDTVRAPDAVFVMKERIEAASETSGYFPGAPDLAVEVISPDDVADEVETKTEMCLEEARVLCGSCIRNCAPSQCIVRAATSNGSSSAACSTAKMASKVFNTRSPIYSPESAATVSGQFVGV